MEKYAVIDIGSNTIRLVVYDVQPEDRTFEILLNEAVVAGLSSYVEDGVMSEEGIQEAQKAISTLERRAHAIGCTRIYPFATAAIRNCTNSRQVVDAIEENTGLAIDVISGEEEAHLGFAGASIGTDMESGVLVDLGGGSTEITIIDDGMESHSTSIPLGCVGIYSKFVSLVFPTEDESCAINDAFASRLEASDILRFAPRKKVYAVGGGVFSIMRMHEILQDFDQLCESITLEQIRSIIRLHREAPSEFAHSAVRAVPSTMHMLLPACIIFDTLLSRFDADTLSLCRFGIREGYLMERIL